MEKPRYDKPRGEKPGNGNPRKNGGGNRNRGDRDLNRNNNRQNSDIKRPAASAGVEDRIAYYKAKYGEDFKPSAEMLKQAAASGNKKSRQQRPKSGKATAAPGQEARKKAAPKQAAPKTNAPAEAPQKSGFFSRLFGKK
jgi:ATP-dependent RNA helicase RhlB